VLSSAFRCRCGRAPTYMAACLARVERPAVIVTRRNASVHMLSLSELARAMMIDACGGVRVRSRCTTRTTRCRCGRCSPCEAPPWVCASTGCGWWPRCLGCASWTSRHSRARSSSRGGRCARNREPERRRRRRQPPPPARCRRRCAQCWGAAQEGDRARRRSTAPFDATPSLASIRTKQGGQAGVALPQTKRNGCVKADRHD
jgi:hypothetical protein